MRTGVSMLGCYDTERHDLEHAASNSQIAIKLVAQIGIIAA